MFVRLFIATFVSLLLSFNGYASDGVYNLDREHVPDQLIVKFKPIPDSERDELIASINSEIIDHFESSGALLLQFIRHQSDDELLTQARELANNPDVVFVEANTLIRLTANTPNDPQFRDLYALHNEGGPYTQAGADIRALEAWSITTGSRNVVAAIVDSGIDYKHPDLAANVWINPGETGVDSSGRDKSKNGVDDDGNGYVDDWRGWDFLNGDNDPMDDNGHGSHCSGIIGAVGNNGIGIVGVNWTVSLMPLKAFNAEGVGPIAAIVKALDYATKMGVTVTSNSYGSPDSPSSTERIAIEQAGKKGILFIAASGNSSLNNDTEPVYPASFKLDNVIAVAATDGYDKLADYSNFGPSSVHLGAPGDSITSTVLGGKYETWGGTSMAAPQVVGSIALIKSKYPNLPGQDIRKAILETVDKLPSLEEKTITKGRLNVYKAMLRAGQLAKESSK